MELLIQIILLIIGFVLLIKGADVFVDGASNVAYNLKIPTIIVGLTIVAFGTSAPEAAVSITSAFAGTNALSLGNVVGSNIFNILAVVGISALLGTLTVDKIHSYHIWRTQQTLRYTLLNYHCRLCLPSCTRSKER